jgi:hypothetical protein
MSVPKHPADERKACLFHTTFALIGLAHMIVGMKSRRLVFACAHIAGGALMAWFHSVGAKRHYDDPEFRNPQLRHAINTTCADYPMVRDAIKRATTRSDALATRTGYQHRSPPPRNR